MPVRLILWEVLPLFEILSPALVASKLFKSMNYEANEDDLEEDICLELTENSKEFQRLAVELLDHCYKQVRGWPA